MRCLFDGDESKSERPRGKSALLFVLEMKSEHRFISTRIIIIARKSSLSLCPQRSRAQAYL